MLARFWRLSLEAGNFFGAVQKVFVCRSGGNKMTEKEKKVLKPASRSWAEFARKAVEVTVFAWKVAKNISLLFPLIAAIFLWFYLKEIGWISLFLPSIASPSGLLMLATWGVLFGVAIILVVIYPSLTLAFFAGDDRKIPSWLKYIQWFLVVEFVTIIVCYSYWPSQDLSVTLWLVPAYVLAMGLYFLFCWRASKRSRHQPFRSRLRRAWVAALPRSGREGRSGWRHLWPFAAVTAMMFSAIGLSVPFLIFMSFIKNDSSVDSSSYWVVVPLLLYVLLLVLPLHVFWSDRGRGSSYKESISRATGIALFLLLMVYFPIPQSGFTNRILEMVHVRGPSEEIFIVSSPVLSDALKSLDFPIGEVAGKHVTVRAWVRYSFGDIVLLCKGPWRRQNVQIDENDMTRERANRCIPAQRGELREWRGGLFSPLV